MKVVVLGSDAYTNSVLRPYVAEFSTKPRDFQHLVRFMVVPLGEWVLPLGEWVLEWVLHAA